jgi:hypothetical protein
MKHFFTICALALFTNSLLINAAQKLTATIISGGVTYNLYISIPDDYNASNKYPLVVALTGCTGQNANPYRDALSSISDSLKMIVVVPNPTITDQSIGDTKWGIITASIDTAKAMYNIDTTSVYLTGFSCNGPNVLLHGLNKMYPYKGIFPWEPYIPSGPDPRTNLTSDMPITIAVGTSDETYGKTLRLYDSLKTDGAKVNLVLVPGIDHRFDFANFGNVMVQSLRYLNDTNTISIECSDASLPIIKMMDTDPARELVLKVKNKGNKELLFTALSHATSFIANPTIEYSAIDSTVKLTFAPIIGKAATMLIVFEAREIGGLAIKQFSFKVRVSKLVSVESTYASASELKVYPNPAKDKFYLRSNEQKLNIQILDITGRIVLINTISGSDPIDISSLKNGIYFLQAKGKKVYPTQKLIKE